jgi:hypothetical protein
MCSYLTAKVYIGVHTLPPSGFELVTSRRKHMFLTMIAKVYGGVHTLPPSRFELVTSEEETHVLNNDSI